MNIKQAVLVMVMNPSINFPWERDVVTLVNSFLPAEGQLDLINVSPSQVQIAIEGLPDDVKAVVYNATLDNAPTIIPNPVPTPPTPAPGDQAQGGQVFLWIGIAAFAVAAASATRVIDAATFLEVFKTLLPLITQSSPVSPT